MGSNEDEAGVGLGVISVEESGGQGWAGLGRATGLHLRVLLYLIAYFYLEDNCCTILCLFLPYINMNQS